MANIKNLFIFLFFIANIIVGCSNEEHREKELEHSSIQFDFSIELSKAHSCLDSAIIDDFFSPPVAARIYMYPFLAANECYQLATNQKGYVLDSVDSKAIKSKAKSSASSIFAFYHVSQELVYTNTYLKNGVRNFEQNLLRSGYSQESIDQVKVYGEAVAQQIIKKIQTDGYLETRSMKIYEPLQEVGHWIPTPPEYANALEPHWEVLTTICLDSASQFRCPTPPPYSLDKNSLFYQELMEVIEKTASIKEVNDPHIAIAKFWDCNPFVPIHQGHVTVAEKKLTPGGHWLRIAQNAMQDQKLKFSDRLKIYNVLSMGIYDGFISCWEAKYHYNYIRPITVIKKDFNESWEIPLYTPNFPEYPSGHSVISGVSAKILTNYIGENYAFVDSSELAFGMAPRAFSSFNEARDEAAMSRLYGGIHFRSAIENGVDQGSLIGEFVLRKFEDE
ncbi:MAG: vanadium-dependent haloperoxidase [Flavobacteriales bacterium]|jgi:hypothetical protein|nr:vanadium-dependent haloperoxidase [Flavobacteriales bacterium]